MLRVWAFIFLSIGWLQASSIENYATWGDTIFINPTNLDRMDIDKELSVSLTLNMGLANKTWSFLEELNEDTGDLGTVSNLLEKNIGNNLSFNSELFIPMFSKEEEVSWLLGVLDSLDGYFITHSGFGSKGAMESYIQHYQGLIGTISLNHNKFDYAATVKLLKKSLTVHNYSIGEMIDMNDMFDYFDNRYTKEAHGVGIDFGFKYVLSDMATVGVSTLNIGDTRFQRLGTLPSITNFSYYQQYTIAEQKLEFDFTYMDIWDNHNVISGKDALRGEVKSNFWNERIALRTGVLYSAFQYGLSYHFSRVSLAFDSYVQKLNGIPKERHKQLSLLLHW